MASLNMGFALATTRGRVAVPKATKNSGSIKEEKGLFDWLFGALQRDQLFETDPVLQRVEDKSTSKTTSSVSIPSKKKSGGFGSLFTKD